MMKGLSEKIGNLVENDYEKVGVFSNKVLQKSGFENTGNFVEEQLVDIGKNTSSNIKLTGQLAEGTVKTTTGYITKDDELKQSGITELNEGKDTYVAIQLANVNEKVEDATKVGKGLFSGDMSQVKDGVTGLIGLKKSAIGLKVLDDL